MKHPKLNRSKTTKQASRTRSFDHTNNIQNRELTGQLLLDDMLYSVNVLILIYNFFLLDMRNRK